MGSCPKAHSIDLDKESSDVELRVNLAQETILSLHYRNQILGRPLTLNLDPQGLITDILYTCSNETTDPEVQEILDLYEKLTPQKRSKVRAQICEG